MAMGTWARLPPPVHVVGLARPEYNYNDDQYTCARSQWEYHMREVSQAQIDPQPKS